MRCRWIYDEPQTGSWNMAADEAMLQHCLDHPEHGPTLRWYRWVRPTISLGYFQSSRDLPADLGSLDCVRRLTGGGAILHHLELTYSLVLPPSSWPLATPKDMVLAFHRHVADALGSALSARLHPGDSSTAPEPFLCFLRRSQGDLVVGKQKILGSAQRNRRGALLQHGSILLQRSPHAPQLHGLNDVPLDPFDLQQRITERLHADWGWEFEPGELTAEELAAAAELDQSKYQNNEWNLRR